MTAPGIEPGFPRPQREVLTVGRYRREAAPWCVVGAPPARSRVGDTSRRRVVLPLLVRAVARRRCGYCLAPHGFIFAAHRWRCLLWDKRRAQCAAVRPRESSEPGHAPTVRTVGRSRTYTVLKHCTPHHTCALFYGMVARSRLERLAAAPPRRREECGARSEAGGTTIHGCITTDSPPSEAGLVGSRRGTTVT